MQQQILGLDLGSNSIGWALLKEENGQASEIIDLGSRIFIKAVEEKVPTPKNEKRRNMRLGRRVIQRRARRKQRMLNYLVSLGLLPTALQNNTQPEITLNELGDPYELRTRALDTRLTPHQFGRVLLHFVARRGFLSTKKQVAGDLNLQLLVFWWIKNRASLQSVTIPCQIDEELIVYQGLECVIRRGRQAHLG